MRIPIKLKPLSWLLAIAVLLPFGLSADPVQWSVSVKGDGTDAPSLVVTAKVAAGYHLYAPSNPQPGGVPLSFNLSKLTGAVAAGAPKANKNYKKVYSDAFEQDEHFYEGTVVFTQKLKPTAAKFSATLEISGQVCNDGGCAPVYFQKSVTGTATVVAADAAKEPEDKREETIGTQNAVTEMVDSLHASETLLPAAVQSGVDASDASWWDNVESEFRQFGEDSGTQGRSLLYIFIAGFLGGLVALVTPCVWPMIPMTMSFFLKKKNGGKKRAVGQASLYGAAIVVIYVGLGLVITAIFGASALNNLATSAIFNIIFFALLVVFAISFMGGFELTLPSSWTNKMDAKVDSTTGFLSLFFMAFTLVLVSFSCTGPIIGTLLVEAAATSNFLSPAVGMLGFSLALALPFTLFAMFPSVLKSMPKSGGWLNTVKVVLGFLELALALKFLSVADLAYGWRILDREVFIALWIVIFALLGVYLLGKLTFPHDSKVERIGVFRFMLACISLSFAIYMVPGLWGAPLKSISAFAPPATTQDFSLYDGEVHARTSDFEEGMRMARAQHKPLLIDFSGHGCVNCRKMEAAVWTDPKVKHVIDNDFILVTLMVDEKKALPHPIEVKEKDGQIRTLRTVGDKWSYLQRSKFGANAQPYYVILDGDGHPVAHPYGFNESVPKFLDFLELGLENFRKSGRQ